MTDPQMCLDKQLKTLNSGPSPTVERARIPAQFCCYPQSHGLSTTLHLNT